MEAFLNSLALNLIYLALLGVGVVYAVIVLIGGLQGLEAPGGDVDVGGAEAGPVEAGADSGDVKLPALSPVAIASFVTAFGGFGLIGLGLFSASGPASLIWALGGGLITAAVANFAFGYFLIRPQGSSEVRLRDIVGAVAEVTTPIPAEGGGEGAL